MRTLVAHVSGEPPKTLSVIFPQQGFSEEKFASLMQGHVSSDHTVVEVDDETVLADVPRALKAMDQPSFDGVNTFIVSRLAKSAGLTVALSGLGGDELFGGYPTFKDVPRMQRVETLTAARFRRVAGALLERRGGGSDRREKLAGWLGGGAEQDAYSARRSLFSPSTIDLLAASDARRRPIAHESPVPDRLNFVSYQELTRYMRNVLLRDTDVMSMAHSLEVRVPFLDHCLVEYVAALPGDLKQYGRPAKPLLADAVADLVPDEIIHRAKAGFAPPFDAWMRGPLRDSVGDALNESSYGGMVSSSLSPVAVRDVWQGFQEGRVAWVRPWALYALKHWGEHLLDRAPPAAG